MHYTVKRLALELKGEVTTDSPFERVSGVASLSLAKKNDIACLYDYSQLAMAQLSQASVFITTVELAKQLPSSQICIIVKNVFDSFQKAAQLFRDIETFAEYDIHATSLIDESAQLAMNVSVGAYSVIASNSSIGEGTIIANGVSIGKNVSIGQNCQIRDKVVIHDNAILGNDVILDSGAVIGARPYSPIKNKGKWELCDSVGRVIIADGVDIGANSTIDTGVYGDTCLSTGVKIDDLVQIAHDVIIGEHTAVIGGSAIGAVCTIGAHCMIGGCSSIAGHLSITDDVVITGRTTVTRSLNKPGIYSSGTFAEPHQQWRKNAVNFRRLDKNIKKLKYLIKEVEDLKK